MEEVECDWTVLWRESEWVGLGEGPNDQHLEASEQRVAGEWVRDMGRRAAGSAWRGMAPGALWEEAEAGWTDRWG